jgi:hypothetical protein
MPPTLVNHNKGVLIFVPLFAMQKRSVATDAADTASGESACVRGGGGGGMQRESEREGERPGRVREQSDTYEWERV